METISQFFTAALLPCVCLLKKVINSADGFWFVHEPVWPDD